MRTTLTWNWLSVAFAIRLFPMCRVCQCVSVVVFSSLLYGHKKLHSRSRVMKQRELCSNLVTLAITMPEGNTHKHSLVRAYSIQNYYIWLELDDWLVRIWHSVWFGLFFVVGFYLENIEPTVDIVMVCAHTIFILCLLCESVWSIYTQLFRCYIMHCIYIYFYYWRLSRIVHILYVVYVIWVGTDGLKYPTNFECEWRCNEMKW